MKRITLMCSGLVLLMIACVVMLSFDKKTLLNTQPQKDAEVFTKRKLFGETHEKPRASVRGRLKKQLVAKSDSQVDIGRDLYKRVASLQTDIENSPDPYGLVSDFLGDVARLRNRAERDFYVLRLVNQLVNFNSEDGAKYLWLAQLYPIIEDALEVDLQLSRPLKATLFGVLYSRGYTMGVDPYEEAMKITNKETRAKFIDNLLPHMVTLNTHSYPEIMKTLPAERKKSVEQGIIEEAIRNKASRLYALDLYLSGGGFDGNHEQEISKLLNDTAWYWKNANEIEQYIQEASATKRRDVVIANITKVVERKNPHEAKKWKDMINDAQIRENVENRSYENQP